ncbi:hypothetical protein HYC85_014522 [Camellia sinensis]|uniref:Uncharacterized protein n=1 Tax=Camellia sinensis TaxID=4442 RepID=A0A7J7H7P0_CAMSI|nr:hypothetical protein HYC85_014522 [Camellia sinensis]
MIGLVIGCSWRPRWTGLLYLGLRSKIQFAWTAPPGFGGSEVLARLHGIFGWSETLVQGKNGSPVAVAQLVESGSDVSWGFVCLFEFLAALHVLGMPLTMSMPSTGTSQVANVVVEKDLEHLLQLIETKGGKMEWQSMMGHSTSNLTYQAWRLDLEDESVLIWFLGKEEKHLKLSHMSKIISGQRIDDAVKNLVTKLHSAKAKLDLVTQAKSKFVLENSKVHVLNYDFYSLSGCT